MATSKDNVQVTAVLPRDLVARLDAYADEHRWSRSGAIAALIEDSMAREAADGLPRKAAKTRA